MTTFNEFVCWSVEFRTWEFGILCEILDSAVRRIFDSTKEFHVQRGVSYYALDHLSVFKIDKLLVQDRSVCMQPYVCTYTSNLLLASPAPF